MKKGDKHIWYENFIYLMLWGLIFIIPVVVYAISRNSSEAEMSWPDIYRTWLLISPFFLIFIINNFLLAPWLLLKKRFGLYTFTIVLVIGAVLSLFSLVEEKVPFMARKFPPRFERTTFSSKNKEIEESKDPGDFIQHPAWENDDRGNNRAEHDVSRKFRPKHKRDNFFSFPFLFFPYWERYLIAVLVLSLNIAVKMVFRSIKNDEQMRELEKHSLRTELEYLNYQINPHFFMNTLNNIHALIDIDKEKAQESILELSKMMRYVLYESSSCKTIALAREIEFLQNYIQLMRLRYIDKVAITMDSPQVIPNVLVPPLLFVTFVENAFKHGISYKKESFIHVSIKLKEDNNLCFSVENSLPDTVEGPLGNIGIGIENTRKRLTLLFDKNYTLDIKHKEDSYNVQLKIPIVSC